MNQKSIRSALLGDETAEAESDLLAAAAKSDEIYTSIARAAARRDKESDRGSKSDDSDGSDGRRLYALAHRKKRRAAKALEYDSDGAGPADLSSRPSSSSGAFKGSVKQTFPPVAQKEHVSKKRTVDDAELGRSQKKQGRVAGEKNLPLKPSNVRILRSRAIAEEANRTAEMDEDEEDAAAVCSDTDESDAGSNSPFETDDDDFDWSDKEDETDAQKNARLAKRQAKVDDYFHGMSLKAKSATSDKTLAKMAASQMDQVV